MLEGKYICFKLGEEEFGLSILNVQEIIKPQKTTKLPEMPDYMCGVLNLRGRVIPVVDLRKRMSIPSPAVEREEELKIVVINKGRFTCGGLVDSITGVVEVKESNIKESNIDSNSGYVMGIATLDSGRLLQLLNLSSILTGLSNFSLEDEVVDEEIDESGKVIVSKKVSSMGGEYIIKEVKDKLIEEAKVKGEDTNAITAILDRMQRFLGCIASGNLDEAEAVLSEISTFGEKELFEEVGKVARGLHNSIIDFKRIIDPGLKHIAVEEMPEASDKLNWVIKKTEEAAGKTLGLVEKNLSLQSDIIKRLDLIDDELKDGKGEARDAVKFLRGALEGMNADFMEIIYAQEFQDLTGQIIKKVISLVAELEEKLVELVRTFGVKIEPQKKEKALLGPQIKETEGVLAGQEDVDALLKEFGF